MKKNILNLGSLLSAFFLLSVFIAGSVQAQSLTVSGTVTLNGSPLAGVVMDSPQLGSTTTAVDGTYTLIGSFGSSYDVTPSLFGYTFNPLTVSGILTNNVTADFAATASTFSISGTVTDDTFPVEGVDIDGGALGTTTTDSQGKFVIPAPYGSMYQLILTKNGYVFNGSTQGVVTGDLDLLFEADLANQFFLAGFVVADGAGVGGVTVDGGSLGTQVTDDLGFFSFGLLNEGTPYTLNFSVSGLSFPNGPVSGTLNDNSFIEVDALRAKFTISGQVSNGSSGVAGVLIDGGELGLATTDANGLYSFSNAEFGATYVISAQLLGFSIEPFFQVVTVNGDSVLNFSATSPTHKLTVHVDKLGKALADIKVDAGSLGSGKTNSRGEFEIDAIPFGKVYNVKVSSNEFEFIPDEASGIIFGDSDVYFSIESTLIFGEDIELISRASSGEAGKSDSGAVASGTTAMSADDRYVVFTSAASNLVSRDTNSAFDVFVHDREDGTTSRISANAAGQGGDAASGSPLNRGRAASISADGARIVFHSDATNLISLDKNSSSDIFMYDRSLGRLQVVSTSTSGSIGNASSYVPAIDANGDAVVFESLASNLIPIDRNEASDIYFKKLSNDSTQCVSIGTDGAVANGGSYAPQISSDGTYVVFESDATNLVSGDTNSLRDVFMRNMSSGRNELISVASDGTLANGASSGAVVSADGNIVAFKSDASNLVSGDTNGVSDVFVRDRAAGTTKRISLDSDGKQANAASGVGALSISQDGSFVAFTSNASNLVPGDTNGKADVFIYDVVLGEIVRASETLLEEPVDGNSGDVYLGVDGFTVVFASEANNLSADDEKNISDVFYRETPLFPVELNKGEKIKKPPTVVGNKKKVTVVMQEFIKNGSRHNQGINANAATPKGSGIVYVVTIKNKLGQTIADRTGKKNRVTVGGLKPGSYSVTYKAQSISNGKVVLSSAKSPKQKFSIK